MSLKVDASKSDTNDTNTLERPQGRVPPATEPRLVVGIGASAGGLEALERFFRAMSATSGLALVVVQHLSPDFKSLMKELLPRHTDMNVFQVQNGTVVEANGIYLIPPRKDMEFRDGKLFLTEQVKRGGINLPIDFFLRSLATLRERAIAVILSGTGSDGSRGIAQVHDAGGLVLVQDIESSGFDGMPKNAIATGAVDAVCPPEEMPKKIAVYAANPGKFVRGQLEASDRDLLVEVTRFFRDSEAFGRLQSQVVRQIIESGSKEVRI